jgi:hypothetical protein
MQCLRLRPVRQSPWWKVPLSSLLNGIPAPADEVCRRESCQPLTPTPSATSFCRSGLTRAVVLKSRSTDKARHRRFPGDQRRECAKRFGPRVVRLRAYQFRCAANERAAYSTGNEDSSIQEEGSGVILPFYRHRAKQTELTNRGIVEFYRAQRLLEAAKYRTALFSSSENENLSDKGFPSKRWITQ